MSKEQMRRDDHSQPDHGGKEIAELLDAYATDELVGVEKNTVEQHLAYCYTCQIQLRDLQHFRELLTSLTVNDQYSRVDGAMVPIFSNPPSFRLADAVINEIVKNEGATMNQTPLSTPSQERLSTSFPPSLSTNRRIWLRPMGFLVAALCVTILAGTLLVTIYSLGQSTHSGPTAVPAPPPPWKVQAGQVSVQNAEGTFALKYMDITPKGFRFYYTLQALDQQGIPSVKAYSYLSSNPLAKTSLTATVQSLGHLGTFNIGVIHVQGLSRVHQVIALQNIPPGRKTPAWQLAPLQQVHVYLHPESSTGSIPIEQVGHPEIIWYGPVMFEQVAFFKQTAVNHSAPHPSYIFVRIDDPFLVTVITKAQYLAIAGKQNFF